MIPNDLQQKINQHSVISFDVYDTLIMRNVLHPYDVFAMLGEQYKSRLPFDFFKERRAAEVALREETDPNLYEIYLKMQANTGIDDDLRDELLEAEVALEKSVTVPRTGVVELFDSLKGSKTLYLISDMHLPEAVLCDILEACGISGFEKLFLSNTYKTNKKLRLYEEFLQETGCEKCLHIGDNYKTDYLRPKDFGMDSYWILSGYDLFLQDNPGFVPPEDLTERGRVGKEIAEKYVRTWHID